MSEAILLADVLKSAPEVTSLVTTDRILAFDSQGEPKKITQENAVTQNSLLKAVIPAGDAKWYRIASMSSYGSCAIMAVGLIGYTGGWFYPLVFCLTAPHGGNLDTMSIAPLNPGKASNVGRYAISKVRVSGDEGTKHIDIYVDSSTYARNLRVSVSSAVAFNLVSPIENPTTLATVKEFDVASVWGGV